MMNEDVDGDPGYETPEAFAASIGLTLPTVETTWDAAASDWRLAQVPVVFVLSDQHLIEDVVGLHRLDIDSFGRGPTNREPSPRPSTRRG